MNNISHSRIELFNDCPYKFKLKYIDELETIKDQQASNPLFLGDGIHKGIEKGLDEGIKAYFDNYYVIEDKHIEEIMKYEILVPKVKGLLPDGQFEYEIDKSVNINIMDKTYTFKFKGYVDFMTHNDNFVDIYDFKYSNNIDKYLESAQLHLYKYFLEKQGFKVNKMYFIFIPKSFAKKREKETIYEFRKRMIEELDIKEIQIIEVKYDYQKVIKYFIDVLKMNSTDDYRKTGNYCDWCEYKQYCKEREDLEMLPSTKRVDITKNNYKKIWIYGAPFSGKTTLADQAPTPLNLNTDGNVKFVSMPRVAIKDEVKVEGRMTKRRFAWDIFKETIDDLEKGSDFETIVVDLLEDEYEYCRLYMYDKLGITHESDDSFRAWDKVRMEFLKTLKRLLNLDYNIILISHEDTTKDITKKTGDKITSIRPNIQEKMANKIAGMVDIVARVVVEDDGTRTLNFKSNEVIFGGGRLTGIKTTQTNLNWQALEDVYKETLDEGARHKGDTSDSDGDTDFVPDDSDDISDNIVEEPKRRSRRVKKDDVGEKPKRTRKKLATEDRYFYHVASDTPLMVKKGEEIDFLNNDDFDEITEDNYYELLEEQKVNEDLEETKNEDSTPRRRTRRTRGE